MLVLSIFISRDRSRPLHKNSLLRNISCSEFHVERRDFLAPADKIFNFRLGNRAFALKSLRFVVEQSLSTNGKTNSFSWHFHPTSNESLDCIVESDLLCNSSVFQLKVKSDKILPINSARVTMPDVQYSRDKKASSDAELVIYLVTVNSDSSAELWQSSPLRSKTIEQTVKSAIKAKAGNERKSEKYLFVLHSFARGSNRRERKQIEKLQPLIAIYGRSIASHEGDIEKVPANNEIGNETRSKRKLL